MAQWNRVPLIDYIELIGGGTPKTTVPEYWNGNIPWLSVKDFNNDKRYVYSTEKHISQSGFENSPTKMLHKDDIIISARGTVGEIAMIPFDMAFNQSCYGIRASRGIDQPFLYYLLKNCISQLKRMTHGSVFDTITRDTFANIEVDIPDAETQKRISSVLADIDNKIEVNDAINDNLEQQAKLIYDYWFTQFDFPDENGKPYCSSGGKMVWNEQLKRNIPENWNVVPLLKLVSWESNSQPPKSEFVYEPKEGYVRFIQNRDYDSDTHITYIPRTKNLSIVDRFDILMDKYGDAGAVRYGIEGAFNVALGKICVHNPNYREYIRSFLGSDGIYKFLHNSCMASTRASLSEANLAILNVVVPDEKIILDYENFLHKIRVSILKNKEETVELINLRDWLLPMLMNGQATIAD